MKIVVTGIAGFIGYHLGRALLRGGHQVVGIDNLDPYYSVQLKRDRLTQLRAVAPFEMIEADISDLDGMRRTFEQHRDATHVVHLAAQAGVRHSLEHPEVYVRSNVAGTMAMLEASRRLDRCEHFLYASSSSVYGANRTIPFSVEDRVTSPLSLYAATKLACEHMAECYAHLYKVPATGFRFFTVYGPWGRPDMATYLFARAMVEGRPIQVFNNGDMERDFTYIDDIVAGLVAALERPPSPNEFGATHRVYNLGNNRPTRLMDFIRVLEAAIGIQANIRFEPMQPGDVQRTYADIDASTRDLGFVPRTGIEIGIPRFVEWFREYHGIRTP